MPSSEWMCWVWKKVLNSELRIKDEVKFVVKLQQKKLRSWSPGGLKQNWHNCPNEKFSGNLDFFRAQCSLYKIGNYEIFKLPKSKQFEKKAHFLKHPVLSSLLFNIFLVIIVQMKKVLSYFLCLGAQSSFNKIGLLRNFFLTKISTIWILKRKFLNTLNGIFGFSDIFLGIIDQIKKCWAISKTKLGKKCGDLAFSKDFLVFMLLFTCKIMFI